MNHQTRNLQHQRGFTLVEIMVVVVILGMLAALVAPAVIGRQAEAQIDAAKAEIATIASAVKMYIIRHHRLPTMEDLITEDERGNKYIENGNFKDGEFLDPWGNPYELVELGPKKFDVVSHGEDGEEGTDDDLRYQRDQN